MAESAAQPDLDEAPHGVSWGARPGSVLLIAIAIAFSAFQLWTAAYSPIASQIVRAVHVGFLLLLLFGLVANATPHRRFHNAIFVLLAIAGFATGLYHWFFYTEIIVERAGEPNMMDLVAATIAVTLVFMAGWIMMGPSLPIICAGFLAYGLFGNYLPGALAHRGYGYDQIVEVLFLGTEGIYGTPTFVSSSYIFLFILFGSFLERAGMIKLFTDVAMGTVGHTQGGPAKVSVVSSGLMGTINGSGVANVVTTGQFTIPLMKRFGFSSAFAGGVEATASMGGQIMPPVMGAVAFIMAETIGVPYVEIVWAAIVPALLYFLTVFWTVHLEAGRLGLAGLPRADLPSPTAAIVEKWYLILPLAALVYLLFSGFTPLFAGLVGLAATVLIILGVPVAARLGPLALRFVFWIVLGGLSGLFFEYGVTAIVALCLMLIVVNFANKGGRETLNLCLTSLAEGAKTALPVGIACALVGVIIGVLVLTGAASTFARVIVAVGEGSLFLSLVLTMLTCLMLGMGIPTIPNYIITSSIAGPALLELGVPLVVSHMFVFYFGIMADLTPPVALAAFAAAPIARESGMKIGLQAMRVAIAGFVIPFMAVYAPTIMLQAGGALAEQIGFWPAVVYNVARAVFAIGLWGIAAIGFFSVPARWWERLWAFAAAAFLIVALPFSDEVGFGLGFVIFAWLWWRRRRMDKAAWRSA